MTATHAAREAALFAAIAGPEGAPDATPRALAGVGPQCRLAIHRRNMAASLVVALGKQFPVTLRLLGARRFDAVAAAHVRRAPPRSPVLLDYGDGFGATILDQLGAPRFAFVADVAEIEFACARAYHAADAPALDRDALRRIAPDTWPALRFTWHPAASVLSSRHPAATIYLDHLRDGEPPSRDLSRAEDCLVARPHLTVGVHPLPVGGHAFFTALRAGLALGEAASRAAAAAPDFDLGAALSAMLDAGVLSTLDAPSLP